MYFGFALAICAQPGAKRPLQHRDYDSWRTIQSQALSRDGKFLAYGLFPEEGDGQLVVRNLATGREVRESAGAIPTVDREQEKEKTRAVYGETGADGKMK